MSALPRTGTRRWCVGCVCPPGNAPCPPTHARADPVLSRPPALRDNSQATATRGRVIKLLEWGWRDSSGTPHVELKGHSCGLL